MGLLIQARCFENGDDLTYLKVNLNVIEKEGLG